MKHKIEFRGSGSAALVRQLFQITKTHPALGEVYEPIEGTQFTYISGLDYHLGASDVVIFMLGMATSIGTSVVANFIYEGLKKDGTTQFLLNGEEVPITKELIDLAFQSLQKDGEDS